MKQNTTLALLPDVFTKAGYNATGHEIATEILDSGEESPLEAIVKMRAIKEVATAAINVLQPDAMDQADQWKDGINPVTINGVKVVVSNGSPKWDYSNDAVWCQMKADQAKLSEKIKERESFLRLIETRMVDPDTGEIVEPAKQLAMGNRTLSLTFPKG